MVLSYTDIRSKPNGGEPPYPLCKKSSIFSATMLILYFLISCCLADTFTNIETGEVLHGYTVEKTEDSQAFVKTIEKDRLKLNPAQWNVVADSHGRNNKVIVFSLDEPLMHEIETAAFEQALPKAAARGPLFILVEIDLPGGRVDLTKRVCAAITAADNCQVIGYVKSGQAGGALSAGAAVSLACDKLYMMPNTVIGAATMVTDDAQTMKGAYGEDVGEKFDSAWRATLASLAQQNGRSGLLAKAMVDKDIEVIEVSHAGARDFVDPVNLDAADEVVRVWSKKGSLLTLTAAEAVQSGIADGIVESRAELLQRLDAQTAEIIVDNSISDARRELNRAEGQLSRIRRSFDLKVKKSKGQMSREEALKLLRDARNEFKALINLARRYPDLGLDVIALEDEFNSIEAAYQNIKRQSGHR
jgi:membrane-bound ClpP family serine protease